MAAVTPQTNPQNLHSAAAFSSSHGRFRPYIEPSESLGLYRLFRLPQTRRATSAAASSSTSSLARRAYWGGKRDLGQKRGDSAHCFALYADGQRRLISCSKLRRISASPELRERKGIVGGQLLPSALDSVLCVQLTNTGEGEYALSLSRLRAAEKQFEAQWDSEEVKKADLQMKLVRRAKETLKLVEERAKVSVLRLRVLFLLDSRGDLQFLGTSEVLLKPNQLRKGYHRSSSSLDADSTSPYAVPSRLPVIRRVSPVKMPVSPLPVRPLRMVDQEAQATEVTGQRPRRLDHVAMLHYHFHSSFALRYPGARKAQSRPQLTDVSL